MSPCENKKMKRKTLTFLLALIFLIGTIFPSALISAQSFLSEEAMQEDYAFFWRVLNEAYPQMAALPVQGASLKALQYVYRPQPELMNSAETYAAHYASLVSELCGGDIIGHLEVVEPGLSYDTHYSEEYDFACEAGADLESDPWFSPFETRASRSFYGWKGRPDNKGWETTDPSDEVQTAGPNFSWSMDAEKGIASCRVESFSLENLASDAPAIEAMYDAIAEMDTLIIDVRGNPGGLAQYWLKFFVQPNLDHDIDLRLWGLYRQSELTKPFTQDIENYWGDPRPYEAGEEGEELSTGTELREKAEQTEEVKQSEPTTRPDGLEPRAEATQTEASEQDQVTEATEAEESGVSETLEFPGITVFTELTERSELPQRIKLDPAETSELSGTICDHYFIEALGSEKRFKGKIVLLVDENSYSATDTFAAFCKRSGFARVVGRPTGGDGVCCIPVYFSLPASGLILRLNMVYGLNEDGASNERFGTPPDLLSQDSASALQDAEQSSISPRPLSSLTAAERAEDFHNFWDILRNAYPMLSYLERKGAQADEVEAEYAERLNELALSDDPQSSINFYAEQIRRLEGAEGMVGHLSVVGLSNDLLNSDYQTYCYMKEQQQSDPWQQMMSSFFENPAVLQFYQLKKEAREDESKPPSMKIPNNLSFMSNAGENWAYVAIHSFLNDRNDDEAPLRDFFVSSEKLGIRNMIVDLRGNLGGYNDYWLNNIVAPNIRQPLQIENIGLYQENYRTRPFMAYYASTSFEEDMAAMLEAGPLPSLIFNWNRRERKLPPLPALVESDVSGLDKAFQETIRVDKTEEQPLFTGQFWLLCDRDSYSASEYFLSFAKRTGFARIVGEESGGDGSCVVTIYSLLPNSGLLLRYNVLYGLNPDGSCSEEHATAPDVPVTPGEDALSRCLELIKEAQ